MDSSGIDPRYNFTNYLESYLSVFRNEESIDNVVTTPPPECSSFYWNNAETKYKVFIPTPDRDIYYSLKEIEPEAENAYDKQQYILKCVSLALSIDSPTDRKIIDQMELAANTMEIQKPILQNSGSTNTKNNAIQFSNYFTITKYFVKDLKDVTLKERYTRKWKEIELTVSADNYQVINVINLAFLMSAKRMHEDQNHIVYHYGQKRNN